MQCSQNSTTSCHNLMGCKSTSNNNQKGVKVPTSVTAELPTPEYTLEDKGQSIKGFDLKGDFVKRRNFEEQEKPTKKRSTLLSIFSRNKETNKETKKVHPSPSFSKRKKNFEQSPLKLTLLKKSPNCLDFQKIVQENKQPVTREDINRMRREFFSKEINFNNTSQEPTTAEINSNKFNQEQPVTEMDTVDKKPSSHIPILVNTSQRISPRKPSPLKNLHNSKIPLFVTKQPLPVKIPVTKQPARRQIVQQHAPILNLPKLPPTIVSSSKKPIMPTVLRPVVTRPFYERFLYSSSVKQEQIEEEESKSEKRDEMKASSSKSLILIDDFYDDHRHHGEEEEEFLIDDEISDQPELTFGNHQNHDSDVNNIAVVATETHKKSTSPSSSLSSISSIPDEEIVTDQIKSTEKEVKETIESQRQQDTHQITKQETKEACKTDTHQIMKKEQSPPHPPPRLHRPPPQTTSQPKPQSSSHKTNSIQTTPDLHSELHSLKVSLEMLKKMLLEQDKREKAKDRLIEGLLMEKNNKCCDCGCGCNNKGGLLVKK